MGAVPPPVIVSTPPPPAWPGSMVSLKLKLGGGKDTEIVSSYHSVRLERPLRNVLSDRVPRHSLGCAKAACLLSRRYPATSGLTLFRSGRTPYHEGKAPQGSIEVT